MFYNKVMYKLRIQRLQNIIREVRLVVVAQLVEQLLPTPKVSGLNPVIGKIYIVSCLLSTVLKRQK